MMILRRSIIAGLLAIPAATAAAAIPETVMPEANCASVPPASVSPTMARLIAEFLRLNAALDAIDADANPIAADRAAADRGPALDALVFHRPTNLMELAAKMSALAQFMSEEDSELFVFRTLAEDATLLAGGA